MDLIHSHLPQCRFPPRRRPALQISQIHGSYRTLRQRESPGHLPRRCAFARLPHHLFESLAERSLARQLFHSLGLDPTLRTPNPIQLDHHRCPKLEACQIPYFPLVYLMDLAHPLSASGTHQFPVPGLSPDPQFQCLGSFVNLVLVYPIPSPSQNLRPLAVSQAQQCTPKDSRFKTPSIAYSVTFLRRAVNSFL